MDSEARIFYGYLFYSAVTVIYLFYYCRQTLRKEDPLKLAIRALLWPLVFSLHAGKAIVEVFEEIIDYHRFG